MPTREANVIAAGAMRSFGWVYAAACAIIDRRQSELLVDKGQPPWSVAVSVYE